MTEWWDRQGPGVRIGIPWALFVLALYTAAWWWHWIF
jgi:hypothetical protein